jgi:alpha-NAC-related protein
MFPGLGKMNPAKMQKLMKKLKMNLEEIPAEQVTIKCKDKDIIINNPSVILTNIAGKDAYQITGEVTEARPMSEEDIEMIMQQTGKDKQTVASKLEELNYDLAKTIRELKKK